MSKRHNLLNFAGAGLFVLVAVALIFFGYRHLKSQALQTGMSSRVWILTRHALDQITPDSGARAAISRDTIYSPSFDPAKATSAERGLHVIPAKTYQSEAKFESDVADHKIPAYVKAIVYDNEPWALTPDAEKQDPVSYYKRGYSFAHAHGYRFIATPVPRSYAPAVALYADVVDLQAQSEQSSSSAYLAAIKDTVHQIQQANPHVVIVAGLSTNPTAGDPTPQQLLDIAHATYPKLVRGWWLNIPGPGAACPKCHQPRPDIGIQFLRLLGQAS